MMKREKEQETLAARLRSLENEGVKGLSLGWVVFDEVPRRREVITTDACMPVPGSSHLFFLLDDNLCHGHPLFSQGICFFPLIQLLAFEFIILFS